MVIEYKVSGMKGNGSCSGTFVLYAAFLIFVMFNLSSGPKAFAQEALLDSAALANDTTYTILADALKDPEKVHKLDLSKHKLDSFPLDVIKFINLQSLNLSKNRIDEIPFEIAQLKNLQELNMSRNKITMVSADIGKLKNLKRLDLSRNDISVLPPQIGQLENLEVLDLWDNNIDQPLPEDIRNLKKLRTLELRAILFSEEEQNRIKALLPHTTIFFSPSCNCKM
jgi:Leucine-rich repeat (LRR) protein